jgi:cytochrome P450/NADPH-cytochrome P450 reductase
MRYGMILSESGQRVSRPAVMTSLMKGGEKKLRADLDYMDQVANELVQHRRDNPTDKEDLLLL